MDVQAYIASGIIEQYALGELSEQEMAQVDAVAREHPEVQEALQATINSLAKYALAHGKQPAGGLWDRIAADISRTTETPDAPNTAPATAPAGAQLVWLRPLAAAASLLLVISIGVNIYFYLRLDDTRQRLARLEAENTVLAGKVQTATQKANAITDFIAFLNAPATYNITLQPVAEGAELQAQVFWNPQSGELYLNTDGLPAPPSGKQYQLWALKDGQPIDAGVVPPETQLAYHMKTIPAADAFAITLEPAGGSPQPTLEQLQVMGKWKG